MTVITFAKKPLAILLLSLPMLTNAQPTAHGLTDGLALNPEILKLAKSNQILPQSQMQFGLTDSQLENLSQHIIWKRLLLANNGQSKIKDSQFFLAKDGQQNPKNELIAMLNAIQQGDDKQVCRFVARAHFLDKQLAKLGIVSGFDENHCSDFVAWKDSLSGRGLSLIFAEEHPNSLGSAFAHAFLKLDTVKSIASQQEKDAIAINYSSLRPNDTSNGAMMAVKSMFGKYDSGLEFFDYQTKKDEYVVKGERDIWQYQIKLSQDELDQIIRHLWETKAIKRKYFFTHDNCATEIVRLIDVVREDKDIAKDMGKIVVPSKIAKILANHDMISQTIFVPSNATLRQAKLNNGADFDFYKLQPNQNNPINAAPTHRISAMIGYDHNNNHDGAIYGVSVRSAYQDLLDSPKGVRKFLDVELMSFDATFNDKDKLHLDKLTIFSTQSYNPSNSAKNNPNPKKNNKPVPAWGLHLNLLQVTDASSKNNDHHLVLNTRLEKGKSWTIGQASDNSGDLADTLCYTLLGAGGQFGKLNQGYRVGIGANLGCVRYVNDNLRVIGEFDLPYWYHYDKANNRSGYLQPSLALGVQYDFNAKNALRFTTNIQKNHDDNQTDVRLHYMKYF